MRSGARFRIQHNLARDLRRHDDGFLRGDGDHYTRVPSSAQTSIRCNTGADRPLVSWIDPYGLTPVAVCHADGFELAGNPKRTNRRVRVRLGLQQHNHSSAGMIPSRNRMQDAMKFRNFCRVLTASPPTGPSLTAPLAPASAGDNGSFYHRH